MKQGTLATKIVIMVLFIGVTAYLAVSLIGALKSGLATDPVYHYTVDRSLTVTGFLVRDEQVLYSNAQLLDVLPAEGERIGTGQPVARVYQNAENLSREREKEAIRLQLEQLSYFSGNEGLDADSLALDKELAAALSGLRASAAARELSYLPEQSQALKLLLLRRTYTYNGVDGVTELIDSLQAQLRTLEAAGSGGASLLRLDRGGTFSALVDGYEQLLSAEGVKTMAPAQFKSITAAEPVVQGGAYGKVIYGSRWSFALLLDAEEAAALTVGGRSQFRFLRSAIGTVSMRLDSLSQEENGLVLAVFSTDRHLADTTLFRQQSADLILETNAGLRIPKRAVRVQEDGTLGVFCVEGLRARFKPIGIVYEGGDYYLVEQDLTISSALRVGDEVIVSGTDLYDGKVIKEG